MDTSVLENRERL